MSRFLLKKFAGSSTHSGQFGSFQADGGVVGGGTITSDPATIQNLPAWGTGWNTATNNALKIPRIEEMEGVQRVICESVYNNWVDGVSFWQANMPVIANQTIVQFQTGSNKPKLYLNITGTNTTTSPDQDETNWEIYHSKNIANWSSNVSNCITEIPQDINLTLSNSTLTLKAGSKVYVPNGFESDGTTKKFDVVTISSDIDITWTWSSDLEIIICLKSDGTKATYFKRKENCLSGTSPNQYSFYYRTDLNKMYDYESDTTTPYEELSLPLGVFHVSTSGITSIDQVFNGFGYIGSTVFVLPGVKGLAPNGRNSDGTLKSTSFNISSVNTYNITYGGWNGDWNLYYILDSSSFTYHPSELYYISDDKPSSVGSSTAYWYSNKDNILYFTSDTGTTWRQLNRIKLLEITLIDKSSSTTQVNSILTKTCFQAVDYNDLNNIIPTGTILSFASTKTPIGYLLCNGGAISRTTYAKLFAVIGTTYGTGDDSTTFNLPNFTNRVLQGNGTGYVEAGLPNIQYTNTQGVIGVGSTGALSGNTVSSSYRVNATSTGDAYIQYVNFDASNSNSIYGNSTTVQPPACKTYFIIKY